MSEHDELVALEVKRREDIRACAEIAEEYAEGAGAEIRAVFPEDFK
jgi:hypothetical protein